MVKKQVFKLRESYGDEDDGSDSDMESQQLNAALHGTLNTCKNCITQHYRTRKWDCYKRYANEYELVFTSSAEFPGIAEHAPISRSFFKLWEILCDYGPEMGVLAKRKLQAMFLAEGPGGFMEAFAKFRMDRGIDGDGMHGMTLMSRHKSIPNWKLQSLQHAPCTSVSIHRGEDNTGDLYNVANIDRLVLDLGERSCDVVTADGGFDFSNDFNNQEETSLRLVVAEVYAALRLQRPEGCFVLKVFDVHAPATLRVLLVLQRCYASVRIIKPLTSRPANSEKYVLCCGARAVVDPGILLALRDACTSAGGGTFEGIERVLVAYIPRMPAAFVSDVVHYNTHYVARQVGYIARTIAMIREGACEPTPTGTHIRQQLCKSMRWCYKYRIPVSRDALLKYRTIVVAATSASPPSPRSMHQRRHPSASPQSSSSSYRKKLLAEPPSPMPSLSNCFLPLQTLA